LGPLDEQVRHVKSHNLQVLSAGSVKNPGLQSQDFVEESILIEGSHAVQLLGDNPLQF
jgi:hypothetical protein